MASFVARPGDWPARSTARLQPSGWAARSAKLLAALLMSQRLMCDVDMGEEQQLRQLEGDAAGGPPTLPESMAVPLTPGGASSARMYTGPIFARTGSGWPPMLWHVQASPAMLPRGDAMPVSVATPLTGSAGAGRIGNAAVELSGAQKTRPGPMRARRTKRMDRRLTHWACVFCRHENANNETSCTNCTGVRVQLGGADATAREDARRACRQRELQGRR